MEIKKQKDINPLSRIQHPASTRGGFSLIEVAIAVGVLALVFGGMLAVFDRGAIAARKTETQAVAYNLLREKLEEKSVIVLWPPTSETQAPVADFPGFEREVVISSPGPGLARIQATVWWDNGARQQTIETLKANY